MISLAQAFVSFWDYFAKPSDLWMHTKIFFFFFNLSLSLNKKILILRIKKSQSQDHAQVKNV